MAFHSHIDNTEAKNRLEKYKKTRNPRDLAHFYQPYMEMIYAVGLKYFKDSTKAEDLVMNIYEVLHKKAHKHEVRSVSSWLYTLAKNECLMALRKTKKEFASDDLSYYTNYMENESILHLFNEPTKEDEFERLTRCLEKLKSEQKQCVELFYLQQKSYKDIEATTQFTMKKVKSHIQNGKRNLKNCIGKNE